MSYGNQAQQRYESKRDRRNPPQVGVKHLRLAAGLTIADVLDRIEEETGQAYTKGAISAVENGKRGASAELLSALEKVYGLPSRSISTDYTPSPARRANIPA